MLHLQRFTILSILLTGCPDVGVATVTSDESTTGAGWSETTSPGASTVVMSETGAPDPTTGADEPNTGDVTTAGLGCLDLDIVVATPSLLAEACWEHPWGRPAECMIPFLSCDQMLNIFAEKPRCAGIDLCDYNACADELAEAECDIIPSECEEIMFCLGIEPPPPPDCCSENGSIEGFPNICGISTPHPENGEPMKCVDCNFWPVLCQTHGCGTANVEDCCLNLDGETVACSEILVPGP